VPKEPLVWLVLLEPRDRRVHLEQLDHLGLLVFLVLQVHRVFLVKQDLLVLRDHLVR